MWGYTGSLSLSQSDDCIFSRTCEWNHKSMPADTSALWNQCVLQTHVTKPLCFDLQFIWSSVPTDELNQYKEVGKQYGLNLLLLVITTMAAPPDMRGIQLPPSACFGENFLMGKWMFYSNERKKTKSTSWWNSTFQFSHLYSVCSKTSSAHPPLIHAHTKKRTRTESYAWLIVQRHCVELW